MTNPVPDLLTLSLSRPAPTAGATRIDGTSAGSLALVDGAATGSFANLLSDAALQPDTLTAALAPNAAGMAPGTSEPLLLALPPAITSQATEIAGDGGETPPPDGNDLPLVPQVEVLTTDAGVPAPDSTISGQPIASAGDLEVTASDTGGATVAGPISVDAAMGAGPPVASPASASPSATALSAAPPSHIASGARASDATASGTSQPGAATSVAPVAPATNLIDIRPAVVAGESLPPVGDAARAASIPPGLIEPGTRQLRADARSVDRPISVAAAAPVADAVAPAGVTEAVNKPAALVADVAAAELPARPDGVSRTAAADLLVGTGVQDPSTRIVPLETSAANRGPVSETSARMSIDQPLSSPGWSDALGKRILVMTDTRLRSAEIRMDPPELGPIDIQLSIKDDKAQVAFQAHHALTRDAIEMALPRLRDMLADQGLVLSQATVSDQSAGESGRFRQDGSGQTPADDSGPAEVENPGMHRSRSAHVGLIDEYA